MSPRHRPKTRAHGVCRNWRPGLPRLWRLIHDRCNSNRTLVQQLRRRCRWRATCVPACKRLCRCPTVLGALWICRSPGPKWGWRHFDWRHFDWVTCMHTNIHACIHSSIHLQLFWIKRLSVPVSDGLRRIMDMSITGSDMGLETFWLGYIHAYMRTYMNMRVSTFINERIYSYFESNGCADAWWAWAHYGYVDHRVRYGAGDILIGLHTCI